MAKIKIGPKSRTAAKNETDNLLRYIRDYTRCHKRLALALVEQLHHAYAEANFGSDGDYIPSLDEADVLLAIAKMIERDLGEKVTSHFDLARRHGRNPLRD